jgi:hypothetical protein
MTNKELTNNQRVTLEAAARSANLAAWPLPRKLGLSAGSAAVVVRGLLQKGLLEKRLALGSDPIWKEQDGERFALVITKAGLAACGIHAADGPGQKGSAAPDTAAVAGVSVDEGRRPRAGTKLAILIALLESETGATLEQMVAATGWQPHSVRGVMSGLLAKKLALKIISEKIDGRRVYKAIAGSRTEPS